MSELALESIRERLAHGPLECPKCGWRWYNSDSIVICPSCVTKYRHLQDKCGKCKDFKKCALEEEESFLGVKKDDLACDKFVPN